MKKVILIIFIVPIVLTSKAQAIIHTEDIRHFWEAFDSIQMTSQAEKKIFFLQKYYLDKASEGLKYTMTITGNDNVESFTAKDWVKSIEKNKEKFQRIRPYTLENLEKQKQILITKFDYFRGIYPDFTPIDIYFVIGLDVFGGKAYDKNLIIGSEVMAKDSHDWGISMVLHEFVHTFQTIRNDALLQHCIMEGTADFIAEIVNQKSLTETYPGGYIDFGNKNEKKVWDEFKKYICSNELNNKYFDWLYGAKGREISGVQMRDLGYFMGYKFCKAYFDNATDKKQALKEIIEWDLSTPEKAREFLIRSGYVPAVDLKFIQTFKFKPVIEVRKKLKKELYGYRLNDREIVFIYKLGSAEDEKAITKLTVAGDFNQWNPDDDNFQMILVENRTFELRFPKSKFVRGREYMFKFVMNGSNWLGIPENAFNIDENSGNLIMKVK